MKFGEFEIHIVSDGVQRLDGGAMFGVVPKVLWEKTNPPDERNRILMGLNCLLVRAYGKNILMDTGIGGKEVEKFCDIYGVERNPGLVAHLKELGLEPKDIDLVINTHFHFDHCGGNTHILDGKVVSTFPKAKYFVQRGEFEEATHPNDRTKASYFSRNFVPIEERGQFEFLDGDEEIMEGISVIRTPGHTGHHQCVFIESEGKNALFLGDLVPMTSHVPYPYIMAYDLKPMDTLETKKKILPQALEENWLLIFEHDVNTPLGHLQKKDGRMAVVKITDSF
ncbi:MBL fold metallo-hydrolase [candidate division TA06 bacterium]|nr:MBL fold metallo-hydrolase [candidate division TA06 bacterium]